MPSECPREPLPKAVGIVVALKRRSDAPGTYEGYVGQDHRTPALHAFIALPGIAPGVRTLTSLTPCAVMRLGRVPSGSHTPHPGTALAAAGHQVPPDTLAFPLAKHDPVTIGPDHDEVVRRAAELEEAPASSSPSPAAGARYLTPATQGKSMPHTPHAEPRADWWRTAVVYQIYVRSYSDSDGDGLGDLPGVTARLTHIAELGADAVWITPFYPSPMHDGGYDVADHRDVDPRFGTLADADALIARAHTLGLRVIIDIVPNHTSDQHPWFQAALKAPPGSPARARYVFRDGQADGTEPPTDWQSVFGGPAWRRIDDGQWYLHLFGPHQPDLDWTRPEVRSAFEDVLRFWLDRGVDGFRFDVAHGMAKDLRDPLRDLGTGQVHHRIVGDGWDGDHPFWDRDDVHDILRGFRRVTDAYQPPRTTIAESWAPLD
ncbi:alpha-amylase family glycosyl hydrolase, partial [Streptomyces sp. NPDC056728]